MLDVEARVAAAVPKHRRGGAVDERGGLAADERAADDVRGDARRGRGEDVETTRSRGKDARGRFRVVKVAAKHVRDGSALDAAARRRDAAHLRGRESLHEHVDAQGVQRRVRLAYDMVDSNRHETRVGTRVDEGNRERRRRPPRSL